MILMACDGIWEGLNDYGENLTEKVYKNNFKSCNIIFIYII